MAADDRRSERAAGDGRRTTVLPVHNNSAEPLELWIEPWGDLVHVPSQTRWVVRAVSVEAMTRLDDQLLLEVDEDARLKLTRTHA